MKHPPLKKQFFYILSSSELVIFYLILFYTCYSRNLYSLILLAIIILKTVFSGIACYLYWDIVLSLNAMIWTIRMYVAFVSGLSTGNCLIVYHRAYVCFLGGCRLWLLLHSWLETMFNVLYHEFKDFLQDDQQMLRIPNFKTDHCYYHVNSWFPYGSTIKCIMHCHQMLWFFGFSAV